MRSDSIARARLESSSHGRIGVEDREGLAQGFVASHYRGFGLNPAGVRSDSPDQPEGMF